jgi:hypothetical protein
VNRYAPFRQRVTRARYSSTLQQAMHEAMHEAMRETMRETMRANPNGSGGDPRPPAAGPRLGP